MSDKKDSDKDEWAWLKASLVIAAIFALLIYFSDHYHQGPDICQTNPSSQSCIDKEQDLQSCSNDPEAC